MDNRTCAVIEDGEQCPKPLDYNGMCEMHVFRQRRLGTPYLPQKSPEPDLPGERWLPVVGWEGLYEVSNKGRVRSLPRPTATGTRGGQVMRPSLYDGYPVVTLRARPRTARPRVHRLVLEAFAGLCPEGQESLHGPGGRADNRWPENLHWGTPVENAADKLRDGTDPRGERCGSHVLTVAQVLEIRQRAAAGETQRALGIEFGVCQGTISACVKRRTWAWL